MTQGEKNYWQPSQILLELQRLPGMFGFDGICGMSAKTTWFSFLEIVTSNISLQTLLSKKHRKRKRKLELCLCTSLYLASHPSRVKVVKAKKGHTESVHTHTP